MCRCNTQMDIRGRCDPIYNIKEFKYCPAKFNTALFHLQNDYKTYKLIECNPRETQGIVIDFLKQYKMTKRDCFRVLELYYKEISQDDYNESEEDESEEEEEYILSPKKVITQKKNKPFIIEEDESDDIELLRDIMNGKFETEPRLPDGTEVERDGVIYVVWGSGLMEKGLYYNGK